MNLDKIEELNEEIVYHLTETIVALEGTTSEHKEFVADKYLTTIEMITEGMRAIKETVLKELEEESE